MLELGVPGILVKVFFLLPQLIINSIFFCDAGQSVFNNVLLKDGSSNIPSVKLQSSEVLWPSYATPRSYHATFLSS